jgi:hypothetical protein
MACPVDLSAEVHAALRAMRDAGTVPARCHKGPIRSAIAAAVDGLLGEDLARRVRPWDLAALRRALPLEITSAVAVRVDPDVLVARLAPTGRRILLRGADHGWRLVRFAEPDDHLMLRPETSRRVRLTGWGPDAVLAALGITKPDDVPLDIRVEDLGQGETETSHRYLWRDGARTVLAEAVTTEIFDGATPATTRLRGVVIDGPGGTLLTGSGDYALIVDG